MGLAWDTFGDGKTAVRAGVGIFFGSVSGNGWGTVENSQPFAVRQQFTNVASLTHPYAALPGGVSPFPYEYTPATARFILPAGLLPIDLNSSGRTATSSTSPFSVRSPADSRSRRATSAHSAITSRFRPTSITR